VLTSAGAVAVRAPRINDKRVDETSGERRQFSSAILPAWCRKSPKINEVLPLLYLHGLSSKDFTPALEGFLGTDAGLSAATITRLTTQWQDDAHRFADRASSSNEAPPAASPRRLHSQDPIHRYRQLLVCSAARRSELAVRFRSSPN
jgi:hypothetical protein